MANDSGSSGLAGVLVGALLVALVILGFLYFGGTFSNGPSKSVSVNVNPPAKTPSVPSTPTVPKSN